MERKLEFLTLFIVGMFAVQFGSYLLFALSGWRNKKNYTKKQAKWREEIAKSLNPDPHAPKQ